MSYYQSIPTNPNGRFVLLATDGQPNCGDPNDSSVPTVTQSIAAIGALAGAGVKTFVLGFGDAVVSDPTTLQAMAQAGQTGMYYAATSPAQLDAALDAIAGQISVPPCTIGLVTTPDDPAKLGVFFDGTAVPRSPEPRRRLGLRPRDQQREPVRRRLQSIAVGRGRRGKGQLRLWWAAGPVASCRKRSDHPGNR